MARAQLRVRVHPAGTLEVIDPGFDTLDLLRSIDPKYRVARAPLTLRHGRAAFMRTRAAGTRIPLAALSTTSNALLWQIHDELLKKQDHPDLPCVAPGEMSLLALKAFLAGEMLKRCNLCARCCGVDRTQGETGVCGLGSEAFVGEHFVHIAEEAPINPSLVLNLRGCGLRCRYCQQHSLLHVKAPQKEQLGAELWERLELRGARTLSFVGGNPDESLPAILRFLQAAPDDWRLPIVWNHHAYMTAEVRNLLCGVADVYVPDLKYFNNRCAETLSGVTRYREAAIETIDSLLESGNVVIVRMLVLPGHFACCHAPAVEHLAQYGGKRSFFLSVRGQYVPDWKIGPRDGEMARRTTRTESERVSALAKAAGLQLSFAR